jgi:hypothetical protein
LSTLAANNITDAAGTGGPTLANGLTIGTSPLAAPSGSAPSYTCRAWVNFNGTGTVAIRASGNVTSITDDGVGLYTVNFTTAMPDANYAVDITGRYLSTLNNNQVLLYGLRGGSNATGSISIVTTSQIGSSSGMLDMDTVCVAIFR